MGNVIAAVVVLALGMPVAWLAKRLQQPSAVWQVLLGLILGPPILGWIKPSEELLLLGELGVVLLLGMAGLHLGLRQLRDAGADGIWVALLGMLLCFAGGFAFAAWWGSSSEEALYVGTILTATSIGISVQVLDQYGLIEKSVGRIVIAAAVIDDVVALYLLAVVHGVLSGDFSAPALGASLGLTAAVLAAVFMSCRTITRMLMRMAPSPHPMIALVLTILTVAGLAAFTRQLGFSAVVGAFFAGLGIGEGMTCGPRDLLLSRLSKVVFVLVPFFFVLIGVRVEWGILEDPGMALLFAGLVAIAVAGKFLGGALAVRNVRGTLVRLLVGASMVPRGEVALVIAGLGFTQGHLGHHTLMALILVTVTVALIGPMLIATLARHATGD